MSLKDFLGQSTFEAAVKTPQQAINFLRANFVGIDKHMNTNEFEDFLKDNNYLFYLNNYDNNDKKDKGFLWADFANMNIKMKGCEIKVVYYYVVQ